MAVLVPSLDQISQFPRRLEAGERALMNALRSVLDDSWTIYVQPFLNGLQPDIIIFSEEAGLGVFEVKDWNLDDFRIEADGDWSCRMSTKEGWRRSFEYCPFKQVQRYKRDIIRNELPDLDAEIALNAKTYDVVAEFVYFPNHTTETARARTETARANHPYVVVFGSDGLQPNQLHALLRSEYLSKGSKFTAMMRKNNLHGRLRNALAYPEHGRLDVQHINFPLTAKQSALLPNTPGKRRVIGAAGSGKTLLLARKAVGAALEGKKVLITCYNITMVNYFRDIVRSLAAYYGADGKFIDWSIVVRHYHSFFAVNDPDNEYENYDVTSVIEGTEIEIGLARGLRPFDVVLIDEGQDFSRDWITNLYQLAHEDAHIMFVEDDRQNIYGRDTKARGSIPITGRPNRLNESFRINATIAALGNLLVEYAQHDFDSDHVLIAEEGPQARLFPEPQPIWYQGTAQEMLSTLRAEVERMSNDVDTGAFPDIVILVSNIGDGWDICAQLDTINLRYTCNFESRQENETVRSLYPKNSTKLDAEINRLRRGRKVAFRMQTGCIKVCTIHSFKGWELRRVLIFNNPQGEKQHKVSVELLYTAMTRSQEYLTILNVEPSFLPFAQNAAAQGLLDYRLGWCVTVA